MIKLIVPNEEYLQSYTEAYNEYVDNNVSTYSFTDTSSGDIFAKFDRYRNERDLPPDRVGEDKFWLVDDEKKYFIGEIAIRHRLNDALAQRGGHIGYGVRYSEWNRGYGTQMLALALEKAKEMHISPVLITCNDDNLASARVMEKNGFVLGDKIITSTDGEERLTRRYWKTILTEDRNKQSAAKTRVISVAKMRAADQYTIAKGTPSKELMRRAAQGVFDAYDSWAGKKTVIVCGSGNNGGDGYALASIMKDRGLDPVLLRVSDKFSEDGLFYYEKCKAENIMSCLYGTVPVCLQDYDIIIDCMLGTGFSGIPREPIASVIKEINSAGEEHGAFVISVDINSGMNGDSGEAEIAVVSDLTVSIGYLKTGFFAGKASELIRSLVNVDIGIELPE